MGRKDRSKNKGDRGVESGSVRGKKNVESNWKDKGEVKVRKNIETWIGEKRKNH